MIIIPLAGYMFSPDISEFEKALQPLYLRIKLRAKNTKGQQPIDC
jgi:hypothetical protein